MLCIISIFINNYILHSNSCTYLSIYLSTSLPTYTSPYLPTHLSTVSIYSSLYLSIGIHTPVTPLVTLILKNRLSQVFLITISQAQTNYRLPSLLTPWRRLRQVRCNYLPRGLQCLATCTALTCGRN